MRLLNVPCRRPTAAAGVLPLVLCTAALLPAQDRSHDLGTQGASVELGATWKRKKLSPDLGEDQFHCTEARRLLAVGREAYLVVAELQGILENNADFQQVLDAQSTVGHDAEIEIVEEARWTRAARSFDAEINGLALRFHCEVLAKDGLAFHLMAWSGRSQKAYLEEQVKQFRDGFEFPGPATAWGKGRTARRHVVPVGDLQLSFEVRPALLQRQENEEDQRAHFVSADESQRLTVYLFERQSTTQQMLDAEVKTLREWDASYRETARREIQLGERSGHLLVGATTQQSIQVLVVQAAPKKYFVLRYQAVGPADAQRPARDALFASTQIERLGDALQLPAWKDEASTPAAAPNRLARFAATTTRRREYDTWNMAGAQRLADGSLVLHHWQAVHHTTATADTVVAHLEDGRAIAATRWGKDWLVVASDHKVHRVADSDLETPHRFVARAIHPVGSDLLLARPLGERGGPADLLTDGATPGMQLIRRTPAGAETVITTIPQATVNHIVVDDAGKQALLCGMQHDPLGTGEQRAALWTIDLDQGATAPFGDWQEVTAIGPAAGGWLVTGAPRGEPTGIWLARAGAAPEPLLTGLDLLGVAATAEHLTFLRPEHQGKVVLHEATFAQCQAEGRHCQPFTARRLEAIGAGLVAALGPDGAPRTAAELAAARAKADALAQTTVGAPLPTTAADVDDLVTIAARQFDHPLAPAGRILLNVLISDVAIRSGASWVEAPHTVWQDWHTRSEMLPDSAFATLNNPANLLSTCLDDSEGGVDPTTSLVMATGGRAVLLGLDPAALRRRCAALVPNGLADAARTGDLGPLRAAFDAAPDNTLLRQAVYAELAANGHLRAVEVLAQERVQIHPMAKTAADSLAWLTAWSARATSADDAAPLFAAALDAVQQLPQEAALYVVLGRAAARAFPGRPHKARQCFERALELQQWGNLADTAKQELAELEGR